MELSCHKDRMELQQNAHAESLVPIDLDKSRVRDKSMTMNEQEKHIFRSKVVQILWTEPSRHNIQCQCQLASNIMDGNIEHLIKANKVIKWIKFNQVVLKFQYL